MISFGNSEKTDIPKKYIKKESALLSKEISDLYQRAKPTVRIIYPQTSEFKELHIKLPYLWKIRTASPSLLYNEPKLGYYDNKS